MWCGYHGNRDLGVSNYIKCSDFSDQEINLPKNNRDNRHLPVSIGI